MRGKGRSKREREERKEGRKGEWSRTEGEGKNG